MTVVSGLQEKGSCLNQFCWSALWFLAELLDVTLISCLFESGHCFEHEVISHCGFDLLLPNFNDFQHLFTCLLSICVFFGKCLFSSYACFLIVFLFFVVICMSSLYILDINPLSDKWFANTFSHLVGCLFILLMVPFACRDL